VLGEKIKVGSAPQLLGQESVFLFLCPSYFLLFFSLMGSARKSTHAFADLPEAWQNELPNFSSLSPFDLFFPFSYVSCEQSRAKKEEWIVSKMI